MTSQKFLSLLKNLLTCCSIIVVFNILIIIPILFLVSNMPILLSILYITVIYIFAIAFGKLYLDEVRDKHK